MKRKLVKRKLLNMLIVLLILSLNLETFAETIQYIYNNAGQLVEATAQSGNLKYTYDASGNLMTEDCTAAFGAPTNVVATAGNGQVAVSFLPPSSTGGIPITGYTAIASPGGKTVTGTVSPIIVTGLTNGTAYTFTVTATNAIGTSPASAPSASVTPMISGTVPGIPTSVSAKPGNCQAIVSFVAPTSNGGNAIKSYMVTSSPGGKTATGTTGPLTVAGLTNGTSYTFTVKAINAVGSGPESAASASIIPCLTVPGAPTGISATPGGGQATINFTAPLSNGGSAITSYTVTSSPGGKTASGKTGPITVLGLTGGTTYTFTVKAKNAIGTGPISVASAGITPSTVIPAAPTNVFAIPGNGSATVRFTAPVSNGGSAITAYTVKSSPGGYAATGSVGPITVTGLTNGTAYSFTVNAINTIGSSPTSVGSMAITPGVKTKMVFAGSAHTAILRVDGSLLMCGSNGCGQLGDGTNKSKSSPVQIMDSGVQTVSTGYAHTAIIKTDGSLWMCGNNYYGELGDGTTINKLTPVKILDSGVIAVSASNNRTAILKTDGSLWMCGNNQLGQLGDGTTVNKSTPVKIISSGVKSVSVGSDHTAILKTDGSLWMCGENIFGQLGDGTTVSKLTPVKVMTNGVKSVSAGYLCTAILKTDGSLWMCGYNPRGQLGDGTLINKKVPVQVIGSGVLSVSTKSETTAIIKADGSLWMWGINWCGQLCDGTTVNKSTPVQIMSSGILAVNNGGGYTAILKTDGSLWMCGYNHQGQLGDCTTVNRLTPVMIMGPYPVN